ncbi:hypothetical protein EZV62_028162 [Acer yangbiense]|uniref:CCHC-type domain-containing protein n=1 Tax=Acer yangbiense TaxID=1000413 RepID=A0A5C7GP00_9ROSI|nr:hypothetical protein EZV62_028162 [Acer yangbiense]
MGTPRLLSSIRSSLYQMKERLFALAKKCVEKRQISACQIRIKIDKPLKRFIKMAMDESERVVVAPLIYERLPEFCFACGKLGQVIKECPDDDASDEALEGSSTKFGVWMRAPGPEMGKSRNQKQLGKTSSNQEGGKSISTSDRSTRGGGIIRIEHNQTSNVYRAESGGSVERMDGRNEDTNQITEELSGSSKDKGTYLTGPSLIGDTITGDRNQRSMISSLEKMSNGDIVAMEEAGIYVKESAATLEQGNYTQRDDGKHHDSFPKPNVRKWKRVARGSSSNVQHDELDCKDTKRKGITDVMEVDT